MTRRGKYGNRPTTKAGYKFDSQAEARYYTGTLEPLARGGKITELAVHPKFILQESFKRNGKTVRAIYYEADFSYRLDGKLVAIDIKGRRTPVFAIKEKLFLRRYPDIELLVIPAKDVA